MGEDKHLGFWKFVDLLDPLFHQPWLLESPIVLSARGDWRCCSDLGYLGMGYLATSCSTNFGVWQYCHAPSWVDLCQIFPYIIQLIRRANVRELYLLLHLKWYQTVFRLGWCRFITCILSTPLTAILTRLRGMEKSHNFNVEWFVLIVISHLCNFIQPLTNLWTQPHFLTFFGHFEGFPENCGAQSTSEFRCRELSIMELAWLLSSLQI